MSNKLSISHLKPGDQAPVFEAKDQFGTIISSQKLLGKPVALYFYPKDSTPTCTVQACNLRDQYKELQAASIQIVGVSMDDEKSHQKFSDKFELPFPLLADTDRSIIESFGVWGNKKFMGKEYDGIHRTTFIIDEKGIIKSIIAKPKSKEHAKEILEIVNN